jgi:octaprenyl-diphosphate synthase
MDAEYTRRLEKIEVRLAAALPRLSDTPWMADTFTGQARTAPRDLTASLLAPGWDILNRGGKRWRPLLMTLICEALGGGDGALPLVPLVELPHNASLIHDDIEDNSDERRGKPAVHLLYGTDTAINGGCFLYFLPLTCIENWDAPAELKNRVYSVWGEHMRRLHLGQAMDINWHRNFAAIPGPEEYTLMCSLKTGALARLAAVLGILTGLHAVTANSAVLIDAIGGAAEKLGVGFQILDDVKNLTTGNPGKKRGDDIVEGKKSLPALLYLQRRPQATPLVERCFKAARIGGTAAPEVEELIGEFEAAGVLEAAKAQGLALINEAREVLAGTGKADQAEARRLLAGFTQLLY